MRQAQSFAWTIISLASIMLLQACTPEREGAAFTGYVEAELVYVAAPDSGWLMSLPLSEGAAVVLGDVLFTLDQDRELAARDEAASRVRQADAQMRDMTTGARKEEIEAIKAQLEEARANLDLASVELERSIKLVARGVATPARKDQAVAEHDAASARVRALQENIAVARLAAREEVRNAAEAARDASISALAQAEWRLSQRTVIAKTGGRIEEVFHRKGEYVTPGAPVLALFPPNAAKIRFFVPQDRLSALSVGDIVTVTADGGTGPIKTRIFHIAREAEFTPPVIYSADSREKLVFLVEARPIEETSLRPGLPVDVRVP